MAYLYRHIRLDKNVPFYIGVGDDKREYKRAFDSQLRSKFWKNVVSKTGYEVEILLDNLPYCFILKKEEEFIKLYGRVDKGTGTLVNLTDGGRGAKGVKYSEEVKKRRRANYCKEKHPFFGKKHSPATIEKMSKIKTGKKQSKETIDKIVKKNIGKKRSPEVRKKMLENVPRSPVLMYSIDGVFIKEYNSLTDAAKEHGGFSSTIAAVCNFKRKSMYGYMWRYKESDSFDVKIDKIKSSPNDKKPVLKIDRNGEIIEEYDSLYEASGNNISLASAIAEVCKGKRRTAKKFKWRYK